MNIVESRLAAGDAEIGIEEFDRFPIHRGIRSVDVSLSRGTRPCSCELDSHIGGAGHWILKSRQRRRRCDVYLVQIHMRGKGTVVGKFPILQIHIEIEISAGLPSPQRATTESKIMRRELNRGSKRIPMHLLLWSPRGRREYKFEVLRRERSGHGWRGKSSADHAV